MRHIWSLIAGIVITPLAWILIAFGQSEMSRGEVKAGINSNLLLGGLLIVAIGLILGLIGTQNISPLGALFASIIFLGGFGFYLVAPLDALEFFGKRVELSGYEANLSSPLSSGTLAAAGGLLLLAVFSPSRWRGSAPAEDTTTITEWNPPAPAEPWEPPTTPASTGLPSTSDTGTDKLP